MIEIAPNSFQLTTPHTPKGDQPTAIPKLVEGLEDGLAFQTLLGATGAGKTFTMASVIAATNRPALVLAPNKTLCAQLYSELKAFFPNAAVEYFVSYFDYFQPETYLPAQDKFIDKDSMVNEYLQTLRLSATKSIMTRNDTIIVATVSAIFGLGESYQLSEHAINLHVARRVTLEETVQRLVKGQYKNVTSIENHIFRAGEFKKLGDMLVIHPAETEEHAVRVSFFDDIIEDLKLVDPLTGVVKENIISYTIFPATHYVTDGKLDSVIEAIKVELAERVEFFTAKGKLIEAQRISERVSYDLEMMAEIGYCKGIENYSRYLVNREPGSPPNTLLDYMPESSVVFIDESHTTIPQLKAMYAGDRSRKDTLIDFGFRLPSAYDGRPLMFEETLQKLRQTIFVSATPGEFELERSGEAVVEQLIRPTGVVDPVIEIRPIKSQVDDLMSEVTKRAAVNERVLVTVLTKQMAEQLSNYYTDHGVRSRYLHGDVDAVERVEILRDLRLGKFDVLVGINLLREGLDLPEVSLVAIMDADKEGFLRNGRSLIQTIGRAARNVNGYAIMYADAITDSMKTAIDETNRRREKQLAYNVEHGIAPVSVTNRIRAMLDQPDEEVKLTSFDKKIATISLKKLERMMIEAAKNLEFEHAAKIRDQIAKLRRQAVGHD